MRWQLAFALLALFAMLPAAPAQSELPGGASFLVYHASGGRDPDPLATPFAPGPAADRLPATFFDRAERAEQAPENAPESAPAHFREMERRLSAREAQGAPIVLSLRGAIGNGTLRVETRSEGAHAIDIIFVVFEHGVPLAGRPQPYVARFATAATSLPPNVSHAESIRLDPSWVTDRIGVVAIAAREDSIVQSATWVAGQEGDTRQATKGVLVEHVTASWCDPCRPADEAIALLSLQRGAAGALDPGEASYFRAPSWPFYAGLVLGGVAAAGLLRRRGS